MKLDFDICRVDNFGTCSETLQNISGRTLLITVTLFFFLQNSPRLV